jgi:hypothetical protein
MTEWKMVHGEGDDPLGPKTYVAEAYGVKFNPPIAQAEVGALIAKLGKAMREYVVTIVTANEKMRKSVPSDKSQKALAEKILQQILENHRAETGQTLIMVQGKGQTTNEVAEEASEHKTLAEKYNAYEGALAPWDLNRALIVRCCEDYVLGLESVGTVRSNMSVTLRKLLEELKENLPFFTEEYNEQVLPTLISDGWVLFNAQGETRVLPYGKGVPGYSPSKCAADHPMWSRKLENTWAL